MMPIHSQRLAQFLLAASLCLGAASAQEQTPASRAEEIQRQRAEKAENLSPAEPNSVEKAFLMVEGRDTLRRLNEGSSGLFPKLGGLQTGQGFVLGLQYNRKSLAQGRLQINAFAVGSTSRSQGYRLGLTAPRLAEGKVIWNAVAERRTLTQVDFYGLGPESRRDNRTSFLLEDTSFDSSLAFQPDGRRFRIGVRGGFLQNNTGRGSSDDGPSTEELFSPLLVPGLDDQANFIRLGGFAMLDLRDNPSLARSGTLLRAEFLSYQDQTLGRHDFNKLELEAQQYIPFFNRRRVIALRARTEMNIADNDQSVPFYLKPWIGGPQELRGFNNYRFYDDNVFVLNAEYRWEVFSGLDGALFLDAGQAVPRRQDFDIAKMETAIGFGFRFNIRNSTFLRLDTGFSNEGVKLWLRWGSPF